MEATYQAELERLREEGCSDPEAYVHRVHTRACSGEVGDHEVAGDVLRELEARDVITTPYPGFHFLVVDRDESRVERCIEVKPSGTNTRRPSISWKEWKSASNMDLRDAY